MAEEQQKQEEQKKEEIKTDPWEDRALSMGWNPDKYDKEDENYIDAKEFVRRRPLFDKIEATTKRLKNVEETLTNLASHHQKVKEVEYQNALKTLRNEKREALKEGDTIKVLEFEDKMDELNEDHQKEVAELKEQAAREAQKTVAPSVEFQTWVKGNDWYLREEEMHDFADGAAAAYVHRANVKGEAITELDVFTHVERQVKKAYPEKFTNPNRERPGSVNSGDRGGKGVKSTYAPSEEERQVARSFVKQGVFKTEDEYYAEMKSIQENK